MEQPIVSAPQAGPSAPQKKSHVLAWILGSCLVIVLLMGIVMAGVSYWGFKKLKKEVKEADKAWEQWEKGAEKFKDDSDEFQKQMEATQKELENLEQELPLMD